MSPERARTHTRRASRDLFVELISIASLRVPVCGCVYTRMSVCTAGIGLCSVAQFWLNKGEYCRTDKETGVQRDRYRYKWEKGEGGRERCWQLKHPSPLWLPCVWSFIFVCVCVLRPSLWSFPLWCHYRLSRSRGSPCLPSMLSELSLWESCIRHRHGNQQTRRASPRCHLQNAACSAHYTFVRWQLNGSWTEMLTP